MKKLLLFLICLTAAAHAQFYSNTVVNSRGNPIAGVTITVCAYAQAGPNCASHPTIYSDLNQTVPCAANTTGCNLTNGKGNFLFSIPSGTYCYQVSGSTISDSTCYVFTVGGGAGGAVTGTGSNGFIPLWTGSTSQGTSDIQQSKTSSLDTWTWGSPVGGHACQWFNDNAGDPLTVNCAGDNVAIMDSTLLVGVADYNSTTNGVGIQNSSGNMSLTDGTSGTFFSFGAAPNVSIQSNVGSCGNNVSNFDTLCSTSSGLKYSIGTGSFVFIPQLAGDFGGTAASPAVAKIQGTSVSGTTGTTNVVMSSAPTINNITLTGTVTAPSGSIATADITPGSNGQCLITSGGVSTFGSCSGTAGEQALNINTSTVTVNAATTGAQNLQSYTTTAGVFNGLKHTFRVTGFGVATPSSNATTETFNTTFGGQTIGASIVVVTGSTSTFSWKSETTCYVTATGATGSALCETEGLVAGTPYGPTIQTFSSNIDFTAANTFQQTVTFSTSSASNIGTENALLVEQIF